MDSQPCTNLYGVVRLPTASFGRSRGSREIMDSLGLNLSYTSPCFVPFSISKCQLVPRLGNYLPVHNRLYKAPIENRRELRPVCPLNCGHTRLVPWLVFVLLFPTVVSSQNCSNLTVFPSLPLSPPTIVQLSWLSRLSCFVFALQPWIGGKLLGKDRSSDPRSTKSGGMAVG